jgi:hypothetical protein
MGLHTPIETHRTHPFGMEILDLRHFSSQNLRPLLERETLLWAQMMSWDYRPSAEMILRYIDSKILPGYAAVEDGRIGGYAFFVYEGSKGVIGDLYADDSIRIEGDTVEQRLAVHVISTLQQSPGIQRIEAQLLPHESGVLSEPFLAEGFKQYPRLFMTLPLRNSPKSDIFALPDIEFRHWAEHDFQPGASLITTAYRGHIDSDINDQYRSLNGSLRFLNNIVRFPCWAAALFACPGRCGSRHTGMRAAGVSRAAHWRVAHRTLHTGTPHPQLSRLEPYRNGGQRQGRGTLPPAWI